MQINFQKLITLPVETKSGETLGHVTDLTLSIETMQVNKVEVKDKKWLATDKSYLISTDQIVSITEEKIIVNDSAITIEQTEPEVKKIKTEPVPTLNAELDN